MKKRFLLFCFLFLSVGMMQIGCSAPHMFWPQKDIKSSELKASSLEKRVLVASRSSEFKDAIVDQIRDAFKDEPVYLKFIGIDQLNEEDGTNYAALVLINTTMSWGMDLDVKAFLKRHQDHKNMIVLTTSGDGDWLPKMEGRNFDAISSASKKANVDAVAGTIIAKVELLLQTE
jgi:hypothetical protein